MMKTFNFTNILLVLSTLLVFSCSEEVEIEPTERYLRIVDDQDYNAEYDPISIQETFNGGSLILSGINLDNSPFRGVKIVRLDSIGGYVGETILDGNYVNPVGDFMTIDSTYYFFCMESGNLTTNLVAVNDAGTVTGTTVVSGRLYPLAGGITSNNTFLLMNYNPNSQTTQISELSADGAISRSAGYSIGAGDDVEPDILKHLTDPLTHYNFFVGESGDGVFFNGFYNYTLSLVFSSFGGNPTGVLQGQQTIAGMKAVTHISGSNFAFLGFQYDQNFVQPFTALSTSGTASSVNFFDRSVPEIKADATAKIVLVEASNGEVLTVFATETEGRQTILYFYDSEGILLGYRYIGNSNPYTFADITTTEDGGLLVTGTTFVASRFERIYVAKIPEKEIEDIVNPPS